MPGPAHETLIAVLSERPEILDALLRALGRPGLTVKLVVKDSAVRVANPLEVRPDLVLLSETAKVAWVLVEIQLAADPDKQKKWLSGASALFDTHGVMGDVIIITHDASVATWAAEVAHVVGPNGTRLALEPVVLLLTLDETEALLASGKPELGLLAAWAVHDQRGQAAKKVVRRAMGVIDAAGDIQLREALAQAMISMLGDPLVAVIREMMMNLKAIPESSGFKALKRDLAAQDRAGVLLGLLEAHQFTVDEATRKRIEGCTDPDLLGRWINRTVGAKTLDEVFQGWGGVREVSVNPEKVPVSPALQRLGEEFRAMYGAQLEVRGWAKALLRVLAARGIAVPEELRARVLATMDVAEIDGWLERAAKAETLAAVFGG